MSPELDRLLRALWEFRTAEPADRDRCLASLNRMIDDALARVPRLTRQELMVALEARYDEFRRANRRPPTIPPRA